MIEPDKLKEFIDSNKQILEEPFIRLPLQAYKTKRNMLIFAVLCTARWYGLSLKSGFKIGGNEISNMDFALFDKIILSVTLYFTCYFIALGWTTAQKWKLRTTGVEKSMVEKTTGSFAGEGITSEVSQSTAWQHLQHQMKDLQSACNSVEIKREIEKAIQAQQPQQVAQALTNLSNRWDANQKQIQKAVEENKIRFVAFEKAFWSHFKDSWFSFWFFEFGGPVAFSLGAMVALISTLC